MIGNLHYFFQSALKRRHDEDFFDKLNNKVTSYVMFAIGLSIFATEYSGSPMKCFVKPQWVSSWMEYAEDYCFIEGTYFVDVNKTLPPFQDLVTNYRKITFYQVTLFFNFLCLKMSWMTPLNRTLFTCKITKVIL